MVAITTNLKVLLLNAENLFLLSDREITKEDLELEEHQWQRLSTSVFENKNLAKTKALGQLILKESPDLILLCEVGGPESLRTFNRLFLNDEYFTALIEGNSDRNIDIGFLIKKNLGFYFDLVTNKTRPINYLYPHERAPETTDAASGRLTSHRFSRDAAELHLFLQDRNQPFLVLLLTHLKSRLDPEGIDPQGFERRQAEMRTLLEIYLELEARFENKVPIAIAGDLNGQAGRHTLDLEFADIYQKTQLEDVCELAKLPQEDRATYYQVNRHRTEARQLDYCFLNPALAKHLKPGSTRIFRYLDPRGIPMDPPTTLEAKSQLPSDHYPLFFELVGVPVF